MVKVLHNLSQLPLFSLKNWGLAVLILYCSYTGYQLLYGTNRLSELPRLQRQHNRLESEYAAYRFERRILERQILMLKENSLNPTYLETLAREKLKVARENEAVLILPGTSAKDIALSIKLRMPDS